MKCKMVGSSISKGRKRDEQERGLKRMAVSGLKPRARSDKKLGIFIEIKRLSYNQNFVSRNCLSCSLWLVVC